MKDQDRELLGAAVDTVNATAAGEGWPDDCLAIDVRGAVAALGEITGETVSEDLVAKIFADFCIGK